MNVMTTTRRLVATGAVAALAGAALVGATSTAATAAPVTNVYDCANPLGGSWAVTLLSDAPALEGFPTIYAGVTVPAGPLGVFNTFTIPDDAYMTLDGFGIEDLSFPDFAGTFGPETVGVEGMTAKVSEMTDNGDGTHSFQSDGTNAAIEVPAAGVYDVLSPAAFTLVADLGGTPVDVPCTLAAETTAGSYMTINVIKNNSTTTASPVKTTLKTTKAAKMKVTVVASNEVPTGKVLVKEGTKTLGSAMLNDLGKATVNMGKLKRGKHTVKVVYKGDGYTNNSATDKFSFTVKRP